MLPVRMFPRWGATSCATTKEWNGAVESEENGTVESESVAIAEEKPLAGPARAAAGKKPFAESGTAGKKSFADLAVSAGAAAESESIRWGIWGLWELPTTQETPGSTASSSGARWA